MAKPIILTFLGDSGQLDRVFEKVTGKAEKLGPKMSGLGKLGKTALLGIAGTAGAVVVASLEMADTYEKSHARLETALHNTNTSYAAQKHGIDGLISSGAKLGFNMSDIEGALASMTTGMGSAAKANKYLQIAENLSAQTGKPLSETAFAVTKAYNGQLRPIKQLGIDLPIAAGGAVKLHAAQAKLVKMTAAYQVIEAKVRAGHLKGPAAMAALAKAQMGVRDAQAKVNDVSHAGTNILDALGQKLGGAAARQADTFGGKVKALRTEITNYGTKLGLWLIPKIETGIDVTMKITDWFSKHKSAAMALAIVVGGVLTAAILSFVGGATLAAVETMGLTAAFGLAEAAALPVGIAVLGIVAAVALVGIGIYELVTHWSTVWNAITSAVSTAWGFITGAVSTGFHAVLGFFERLPGQALGALASLASRLLGWATSAFLTLVSNMPRIVGTFIGFTLGLPFRLIGALLTYGPKLIAWAAKAFLDLVSRMPGIVGGLVLFMGGLVLKIIVALAGFELKLLAWAARAFLSLVTHLPGYALGLFRWFAGLPGAMIRALGDIAGAFLHVGELIIQGIANGIGSAAGALGGALKSAINSVPGGGLITGGLHKLHVPGFAGGVRGFGGGLALVGERGPELLQLPRGSNVFSNHDSRELVRSSGSGPHIEVNVASNANPHEIAAEVAWVAKTHGW